VAIHRSSGWLGFDPECTQQRRPSGGTRHHARAGARSGRCRLGSDQTADSAPGPGSPLGCHRPRVPDRLCSWGILIRLVTGCSWVSVEAILNRQVSDTTLRARRDEWTTAGVFDGSIPRLAPWGSLGRVAQTAARYRQPLLPNVRVRIDAEWANIFTRFAYPDSVMWRCRALHTIASSRCRFGRCLANARGGSGPSCTRRGRLLPSGTGQARGAARNSP
jgi:hypothetical protein